MPLPHTRQTELVENSRMNPKGCAVTSHLTKYYLTDIKSFTKSTFGMKALKQRLHTQPTTRERTNHRVSSYFEVSRAIIPHFIIKSPNLNHDEAKVEVQSR